MTRFTPALIILSGLLAGAYHGPANAAQDIVNTSQICDQLTAQQERQEGIPRYLLKAISLAETGRWNKDRQASFAWPWTVMAQGQGRFFPTRQAALDYIYSLRERGISNIDVGCMQINLYYHGSAFASIEQALDPAANTAYAASHLKSLFRTTRSWTQAAALYHSSKPDRARAYKLKVLKHWNAARRSINSVSTASTVIDYVRMNNLNRRHNVRSKSASSSDPAQLRRDQLAAWKAGRAKNPDIGQLAVMRRATLESQRKREYLGTERDYTGKTFATKRRQQLDQWRITGLIAPSG